MDDTPLPTFEFASVFSNDTILNLAQTLGPEIHEQDSANEDSRSLPNISVIGPEPEDAQLEEFPCLKLASSGDAVISGPSHSSLRAQGISSQQIHELDNTEIDAEAQNQGRIYVVNSYESAAELE